MYVVVSHHGLGINVYGPFATEAYAMDWGDLHLGSNNPFWSVDPVEANVVEGDPNSLSLGV
jgi:hypothetical protein